MPENLFWLECLLRILLATVLGFALGIERQLRLKVAGIRTHVVVAAGAALFTIVSFYGFTGADTARIAAQVVSGIGFIGAGMILHRQNAVLGLTSAAGIWLTAAIAMAAGAGLYYISLGATVLIICIQLFLHLPLKIFKDKRYVEITVLFNSVDGGTDTIKSVFNITHFNEFKADRTDGEIVYRAVFHTKQPIEADFISKVIAENPFIISIQKSESES